MHLRTKCALAGLAAAMLLAFAVGSTSANRLSITNRNFRITWVLLSFFDKPSNAQTECAVTMEGSFHSSTIIKRRETLIGFITRAIANEANCNNGGESQFNQESLPWHLTYQGFTGTLPVITSMKVLVAEVAYENTIGGTFCEFEDIGGESLSGIFAVEAAGRITTFEFDPATEIPTVGGEAGCPIVAPRSSMRHTGTVTLLGNTTRITMRLI